MLGAADRHPRQHAGADPGRVGRRAARRRGAGRGRPPTASRATSRASSAASSGRCWRARPSSACTRPRTCRAELPAGLEIAAVPRARGPGRRLDRRRRLARGRARGRAGRDRQPAPPRPAARGAARPAGARSCTATSTPACASWPRASSTGSSSPPPGCGGWGARRRSASRWRPRRWCRRRARGRWRCRSAPATRRRSPRSAPSPTSRALRELTAERAGVAPLGASCATPIGVHARVEGERLALTAFVGLPDGSEWIRDRLEGDAAEPAARRLRPRRAPARRRRRATCSTGPRPHDADER